MTSESDGYAIQPSNNLDDNESVAKLTFRVKRNAKLDKK